MVFSPSLPLSQPRLSVKVLALIHDDFRCKAYKIQMETNGQIMNFRAI